MFKSLIKQSYPFVAYQRSLLFSKNPLQVSVLLSVRSTAATCSTKCQAQVEDVSEEHIENPKSLIQAFRTLGCNDDDLSKLFSRSPSLRNAKINYLQPKLSLLQGLGITPPDLVKIIDRRPGFLRYRLNRGFDEPIEYLMALFGSKEMIVKAIVRNPSFLTYDYHRMRSTILLYEELGICGKDLTTMLLSRPMMIARTRFCDVKLEYIQKAGITKDSKMYKHLVSIIGISKVETINEKVANFKKFGFSDEEIWRCFGRSPFLLTFSVDKIQRNMTFVSGTMKLHPHVAIKHPFLLFNSLEGVTKPRFILAGKIHDMGLCPQIKGPLLLRALKMEEKRFMKACILCHPEQIAAVLIAFYENIQGVKRLSEASKKQVLKGFPF